jgi:hypothetical protein
VHAARIYRKLEGAAVSTLTNVTMVLDPRAEGTDGLRDNGPDVGSLRGKTIGLKTDEFWFAWDWVAEEWAAALRADGADCLIWREPMPQGVRTPLSVAAFQEFTGSVDAVVTGLANCGSCTFVAIRAGMAALERGYPTVFVATEHFERLARVLTEEAGWADIRMAILPYPLEGLPEQEIRQIARDTYPSLLESMGAIR